MRKLLAFSFVLIAAAAQAQPETVRVERSRGLEGLWKISVPSGIGVGFSGPAKFGPMSDLFCRITQDDEIHCLSGGYPKSGTAELAGKSVHIAWGSMMARMVIDAVYDNDSLAGTFTFKLSGLRHDAPERSIGARIVPPTGSDDASKYLASIFKQLAEGEVTIPLDAKAIEAHGGALPKDVKKLGDIEAIAFLGRTPRQIGMPNSDLYSVHIVEFAHGERLCGVHQNADGVLGSGLID